MIANLNTEQTETLARILASKNDPGSLTIRGRTPDEDYPGAWRVIELRNGPRKLIYLLDIYGDMQPTNEQQEIARKLGRQAGQKAGKWAADGNTSQETLRNILKMNAQGDPELHDCLPNEPNLSGEWADDLTPVDLACDVLDLDGSIISDTIIDALSGSWEEGVQDTFVDTCIETVQGFLTDKRE